VIAPAKPVRRKNDAAHWHEPFLEMLPTIFKYARNRFYYLAPEARDDAVQEVIAKAMVAYVRLVKLGKADIAYASVLARFGVTQTREGRRVGSRWARSRGHRRRGTAAAHGRRQSGPPVIPGAGA
jgi:hypothetical protein